MAYMMWTMTFQVDKPKEGMWRTEVDALLQAVAWAIQFTVNERMKYAPANLLFNKDIIVGTGKLDHHQESSRSEGAKQY